MAVYKAFLFKAVHDVPTPKMTEAEREAYKARGNDERLFAHLLDAHGGRHVRVRDPKKVWQHLMYGVLVVVVEQTMRSAMLC